MLKLGRLTDYATLVMTQLALEPAQMLNARDLAERSRVASPTVAKLLRQLSQATLVQAERGAHGGYRLARPAAQISIAAIVTAIEGPVALTECAGSHSHCAIEGSCGVRSSWRLINSAVQRALEAVSLQQMADSARPVARHVGDHEAVQPLSSLAPVESVHTFFPTHVSGS